MQPVRVLVVDDHPFFRSGVSHWLKQQDGMVCCGEAESVQGTRKAVAELHPDLVLLDLRFKDGDGIDLAAELTQNSPGLRILVVSQSSEEVFAHRALQAGARGYLMKSEATETMLEAIRSIMRGEIYVSRAVAARILHNLFPDPASSAPDLALLSNRELQVFQMLGAGCRQAQIASALKISPKTVDTYHENLKQKLHLPDAKAVLAAAKEWVYHGNFQPGQQSSLSQSRSANPTA